MSGSTKPPKGYKDPSKPGQVKFKNVESQLRYINKKLGYPTAKQMGKATQKILNEIQTVEGVASGAIEAMDEAAVSSAKAARTHADPEITHRKALQDPRVKAVKTSYEQVFGMEEGPASPSETTRDLRQFAEDDLKTSKRRKSIVRSLRKRAKKGRTSKVHIDKIKEFGKPYRSSSIQKYIEGGISGYSRDAALRSGIDDPRTMPIRNQKTYPLVTKTEQVGIRRVGVETAKKEMRAAQKQRAYLRETVGRSGWNKGMRRLPGMLGPAMLVPSIVEGYRRGRSR